MKLAKSARAQRQAWRELLRCCVVDAANIKPDARSAKPIATLLHLVIGRGRTQ